MLALPPAPAPAPRRQLFVGTALVGGAVMMFFAGMLAIWWRFREAAGLRPGAEGQVANWKPKNVVIPEVPTNIMLFTIGLACVMAQFAVWSAKRGDRTNTVLGLGIAGVLGLALINAQAVVYGRMKVGIRAGAYETLFYGITGAFVALMIVVILYTVVAAFRFLGGRTADQEFVASVALFWYIAAAVFAALWFVIYVTK